MKIQEQHQEFGVAQIQDKLKYREKILHTISQAAEILLTADEEDTMDSLMAGMELLGICVDVDRVQIWRNEVVDGELHFVMRYEWLSEVGKQKREVPLGLKFPYVSVPGWLEMFLQGEHINAPIPSLRPNEAAFLGYYEMKAIVILPLFLNKEFIGFFSVDDCKRERTFTDDEMEMFASAGLMFASVFNRMEQVRIHSENEKTIARAQKALKNREKLLATVNNIAAALLTVADNYGFDNALMQGMEMIGKCLKVDRVQLWYANHTNTGLHVALGSQWASELGLRTPQVELDQEISYGDLPEWEKMFFRGECFNGPVANLPPEERQFLSPSDALKSTVIIPVFLHERFWGFFTIDDCVNERTLASEEIDIMRSASLMIASTAHRVEQSEKIAETNKQLEDALEQALTASRAKSDFLSTMSHEMRTPMNAIIGMTAIAKNAESSERREYALDKVEKASHHLLGIINDVLDMSRVEANKLVLHDVEIDFKNMLQNVASFIEFRMEEKQHRFFVSLADDVPLFYTGDDQRLTQILTNLLANAVIYTPEGGQISLGVSLVKEESGICEIRFEVADSGIGIPPEHHERLFEVFERMDNSAASKYSGTGLGLPISKRLIELMGGSISVESELGKGSRFVFSVKLARIEKTAEDASSLSARGDAAAEDVKFAGKRLLIAEDMEINREILIAQLDGTGLLIDAVENGREAVEIIEANPNAYDLVFMDMRMPEIDGLEATRRIRSLPAGNKKLPIIAMTANVFADDIENCLAAGMDDHIGKPLDMQVVFEKLRKYL